MQEFNVSHLQQKVTLKNELTTRTRVRVLGAPYLYSPEFLAQEKLDKKHGYGFDYYYSRLTPAESKYYDEKVRTTVDKRLDIMKELQGGWMWKKYRVNLMTLSDQAEFIGDKEIPARKDEASTLHGKVHGKTFTAEQKKHMRRGNDNEDPARQHFITDMNKRLKVLTWEAVHKNKRDHVIIPEQNNRHITIPPQLVDKCKSVSDLKSWVQSSPDIDYLEQHVLGLKVDPERPEQAGSSDTDLFLWGVLFAVHEIKCNKNQPLLLSIQYFTQSQGNTSLTRAYFGNVEEDAWVYQQSWQPNCYRTEIYKLDQAYREQHILPLATKVYFEELLPELVKKHVSGEHVSGEHGSGDQDQQQKHQPMEEEEEIPSLSEAYNKSRPV